jgi:hypothetical protein
VDEPAHMSVDGPTHIPIIRPFAIHTRSEHIILWDDTDHAGVLYVELGVVVVGRDDLGLQTMVPLQGGGGRGRA